MKWVDRESGGNPTIAGEYRVRIAGDYETEDGYTIWEIPDYSAWATWSLPEEGEKQGYFVLPFEEDSQVFAWLGPINVPEYENELTKIETPEERFQRLLSLLD